MATFPQNGTRLRVRLSIDLISANLPCKSHLAASAMRASRSCLGFANTELLRQNRHLGALKQDQHLVGPLQVTFQVEEPRFAAPGRGLQKAPRGLLQLLSRALARLDKAGPTRVGLELVFQQDGQTVGDVVGLDDALMILLCPLPRANSR